MIVHNQHYHCHLDPLVHTVALASLDEEQLRLPGKTWTAVGSKRLPHLCQVVTTNHDLKANNYDLSQITKNNCLVCWVRSIIAVENALVAMTEKETNDGNATAKKVLRTSNTTIL